MAIGDSDNILERVRRLLPRRWWQWGAPLRDTILGGLSDLAAWCFDWTTYARKQTRLATATGIWLDVLCYDFLQRHLTRGSASDEVFRKLIDATIFTERVTRSGMSNAVATLTGSAPWIFEPWNTGDTGAYSGAGSVTTKNMLLWSQQFDNAIWLDTLTSVTPNVAIAPDGTSTADKLVEAATNGQHWITQTFSVANGIYYVISCHLKAAERGSALLGCTTGGGAFPFTILEVHLGNGTITVGAGAPLAALCVPVGTTGWYRVSFCVKANGTGTPSILVAVSQDGVFNNSAYQGDGSSGIYVWGAQVEVGSYADLSLPTPYTPTTSSAVTVAVNPQLYGQMGYGVGQGGYGSMNLPGQVFMKVLRGANSGVPNADGYGGYTGGYGSGSVEFVGNATRLIGVTDEHIEKLITFTKPTGVTVWLQIL
ncbi:hypothetical protein HU675_0038140 [Bradyrhizobium septentrionale]|uniref:phage head spike fiber domain-containing protein n=1 Tax=Bradyrhizobium septentrionale TaxID=1404411 RepID=UPI0015967EA3|nr:hypothetical protein [Bradyrhizobium septentrionale]UGY23707.1 hypothetical protein HU675_0038140 [Bradyrhizobium septentrionale]